MKLQQSYNIVIKSSWLWVLCGWTVFVIIRVWPDNRDGPSNASNFETQTADSHWRFYQLHMLWELQIIHLSNFIFWPKVCAVTEASITVSLLSLGNCQLELVVSLQQHEGFGGTGEWILICWFHKQRGEHLILFSAILHWMKQIFRWVNGFVIAVGSLL
jgi:hypothetical protein